jgi:hypothetical protein
MPMSDLSLVGADSERLLNGESPASAARAACCAFWLSIWHSTLSIARHQDLFSALMRLIVLQAAPVA